MSLHGADRTLCRVETRIAKGPGTEEEQTLDARQEQGPETPTSHAYIIASCVCCEPSTDVFELDITDDERAAIRITDDDEGTDENFPLGLLPFFLSRSDVPDELKIRLARKIVEQRGTDEEKSQVRESYGDAATVATHITDDGEPVQSDAAPAPS